MINSIYKNNKTNKLYVIVAEAMDCTSRNEGCHMLIYRDYSRYETLLLRYFTRDAEEFYDKFTEIGSV